MNSGIENCLKNLVYMESLIKSKETQLKKLKEILGSSAFDSEYLTSNGEKVEEHIKRLSVQLQEEYRKYLHVYEHVYHEIEMLPIKYKSAFEAHYLSGETWKDTAEELLLTDRQIYRIRNEGLELLRLKEIENKKDF